ncbi:MAG: zinc-dependent alcohol dehydrogenase [Planctomycetota bacterium]
MSATATLPTTVTFIDQAAEGTRLSSEPMAPAQPHEMRLKTSCSLISVGTELAYRVGGKNLRPHRGRSGYSLVARVAEPAQTPRHPVPAGAGAGERPFQPGDRVFCDAGHASQLLWDTARPCYRIPDAVTDRQATFGALGQIGMHMIERAQLSVGRTVVVIGQGTVGQLVNQLARLAGAGRVIGVDLSAPARELALQLGADAAIPPDAAALRAELAKQLPGSVAPVFIEVTASVQALAWTLAQAPRHARVVVTGTYGEDLTLNPFDTWIERELDIVGAHQPKCPDTPQVYTPYNKGNNLLQVYAWIAAGRLRVDPLIDVELSPAQAVEFFNAAAEGRRAYRQPLVNWAV